MKNLITILCLTLLVGCSRPQENSKAKELKPYKDAIEKLLDLKPFGFDPDDIIHNNLLKEVSKRTNGEISTYEQLVKATSDDKNSGLLTFTTILWTMAGLFVGVASIWLYGFHFIALARLISPRTWEVSIWMSMVAMSFLVSVVESEWQIAVLIPICLGFMGAMSLTIWLHKIVDSYEIPAAVIAICWGTLAVCYGSHVVGFMSVMAALTSLGFVCGYIPGVTYIGFSSNSSVFNTTLAGGIMLFLHTAMTIAGIDNPTISVFREGMNFMGSLTFYLGLLTMSSKWYWLDYKVNKETGFSERHTNWKMYLVCQALIMVFGLLSLFLGSVYGMSAMMGFGGTFFCMFILEKYYEIPWKGQGWAWSLLGLGLILYVMGSFVKTHPQYFLMGM